MKRIIIWTPRSVSLLPYIIRTETKLLSLVNIDSYKPKQPEDCLPPSTAHPYLF